MNPGPVLIQLALVSHTNAGKTTLARTLLATEIGEVRDAAHVTLESSAHTLLRSAADDRLTLWDTPGFGDSVRLLRRLVHAGNPIGWFLREVVDRHRDRPFWLSQQALRTARDDADVILYLVNAAENPGDTGYLDAEMQILGWLGKPVLVLLNQIGAPRPAAAELHDVARWRQALAAYPLVRAVLPLDAFARCWVHEQVFYDAIAALLPVASAAGYARLVATWAQRNAQRYGDSTTLIADLLLSAAADHEAIGADTRTLPAKALQGLGLVRNAGQRRQDQAMQAMVTRLNTAIAGNTAALLALHELNAGDAGKINARVREHFTVRAPIDQAQAGLLGAVISGATTGLTAEIVSGGLTAGLGLIIGGIVGGLGFAGAAWGFNASTDRQSPRVTFNDAFLRSTLVASLMRYLAVVHFGRGRGRFVESEAPAFWQARVELVLLRHDATLVSIAAAVRHSGISPDARKSMHILVRQSVGDVLQSLYPDAVLPVPLPPATPAEGPQAVAIR